MGLGEESWGGGGGDGVTRCLRIFNMICRCANQGVMWPTNSAHRKKTAASTLVILKWKCKQKLSPGFQIHGFPKYKININMTRILLMRFWKSRIFYIERTAVQLLGKHKSYLSRNSFLKFQNVCRYALTGQEYIGIAALLKLRNVWMCIFLIVVSVEWIITFWHSSQASTTL